MDHPIVATHVALLSLSGLTTAVLAIYAWRHRREPGARAFSGLLVAMTVWTGSYLLGLLTLAPAWRLFWEQVQWFGTATIPVFFLLFAVAYTGHDWLWSRRWLALLAVIPAVTLVLVWTDPLHGLVWVSKRVVVVDGVALIESNHGPWFWVAMGYSYLLIATGSALLIRLVVRSDYLFTDQSAVLLVGVVAPVLGNVVSVAGATPLPGFDVTPYAFVVTGVAFGYALFRRRLFDLVPATRQLGRATAISQIDEGVLILDRRRRVVYANEAAETLLGCPPDAAVGQHADDLVGDLDVDFDAPEALATAEIDDAVLEIRSSPVTDRRGQTIGHTLVAHDVTARERRERALARQRDELETVNELNAIVRGVNQALVAAADRAEIARAVCDRLARSDLYASAAMADPGTWRGDGDRWTSAGEALEPPTADLALAAPDRSGPRTPVVETDGGTAEPQWIVVPVTYESAVFGGLGIATERGEISARERSVLGELGELVGHALDAVERRQLLTAARVVELEVQNGDSALARATASLDCRLETEGIVPTGTERLSMYLVPEGAPPAAVRDELAALVDGQVRLVGDGSADSVLQWTTGPDALPTVLSRQSGRLEAIEAADGSATCRLTVPSDAAVRTILTAARDVYPDTSLAAKRTRERSIDDAAVLPMDPDAELTDRQREAIEAAYRAGYFEWPRESTAEEVADTLDIAPSTLHGHLRKAERAIVEALLDDEE